MPSPRRPLADAAPPMLPGSRAGTRVLVVALVAALLAAACSTAADSASRPATTEANAAPTAAPPTTAPLTTAPLTTAPRTTEAPTTTEPATLPASGALLTGEGLVLPIRATVVDGGWVVGTPCGAEATVRTGTALVAPRVVLDPGHGGLEEPGSVGPNGLREADVNLEVARRVEQWLTNQGVSVLLTRTTDVRLSLDTRVELATGLGPELFVSIHHNGGPVGPSPGPGTLAFHQADSAESRRLGGLLYETVSAAIAPLDLPWAAGAPPGAMTVRNERGTDYYAVLREMPGITSAIIESMYITNGPEAASLADPAVQQIEAEAIGSAILRYLTTVDPGSGFQPQQVFGSGAVPTYPEQECVDPELP